MFCNIKIIFHNPVERLAKQMSLDANVIEIWSLFPALLKVTLKKLSNILFVKMNHWKILSKLEIRTMCNVKEIEILTAIRRRAGTEIYGFWASYQMYLCT